LSPAHDCLFCRIIDGSLPADKVLEDEEFLAIRDKYPKAPVHVLVMPKRHIASLNEIGEAGEGVSQRMLEFVVATARHLKVVEPGYRVITNVGSGGGQVIFHLHWHLIAGKSIGF
jgi:histidine triad (HIT) family protein